MRNDQRDQAQDWPGCRTTRRPPWDGVASWRFLHRLFDRLRNQLMGRSLKTAKAAGASFEKLVADYLAEMVDDRIERRRLEGKNDRGDIAGLRVHGQRVVLECKNYGGRIEAASWIAEAEVERVNDNALAGVVVAKRKGTQQPGEQYVFMTLRDFVALIEGKR